MRIFLSYAAERAATAELVALRLREDKHRVFFDQHYLRVGDDYVRVLKDEINLSDLVIFLVSRESILPGRFALTELEIAKQRWLSPRDYILTVVVDDTPSDALPPYLRANTVLRPRGDVATEVQLEVQRIVKYGRRNFASRIRPPVALSIGIGVAFVVVFLVKDYMRWFARDSVRETSMPQTAADKGNAAPWSPDDTCYSQQVTLHAQPAIALRSRALNRAELDDDEALKVTWRADLSRGTGLRILGTNNGWHFVETIVNGSKTTGFVSAAYGGEATIGPRAYSWIGEWVTRVGREATMVDPNNVELQFAQSHSDRVAGKYGYSGEHGVPVQGAIDARTVENRVIGTWTETILGKPFRSGALEFVMMCDGRTFIGQYSRNGESWIGLWKGARN